MKIPKVFLLGSLAVLGIGGLVWRIFFPEFPVIDGIFIFFMAPFCLWAAAACLLGLWGTDIPKGYRLGYAAVFIGFFFNQIFHSSENYTFFNLALILTIFLLQRFEHRPRD